MAIDYTNPDWCCIHGVVNHLCRKCKDPSLDKPAVLPAMSRALEPEMYNVLAGEIRKLGEKLERFENDCEYLGGLCAKVNDRLLGLEDLSVQLVRMEATVGEIKNAQLNIANGINTLGERQQLIMQKLETNHQSLLARVNVLGIEVEKLGRSLARRSVTTKRKQHLRPVTRKKRSR